MQGPSNSATYGIGWTAKQVKVREILTDRKIAACVDDVGQHVDVYMAIHRTGITPVVGQTWIIDRSIGGVWSFAAWLDV